jgi:predicted enzyme related to lactoylglutathione lyase
MTSQLFALCIDASRPPRLAEFWSGVLGWLPADDPRAGVALLPSDDTGFRIRFVPGQEGRDGPNRIHFDLTSTSLADQQQKVARALELGARHIDVGQRPEDGHVVLADPEGNEFCVIEPGNNFLADCGLIGALSCDGTREVGYFPPYPTTVIRGQRPTVCSPWGRLASTPARVCPAGWRWPIPTATSSAW